MIEKKTRHSVPARLLHNPDLLKAKTFQWGPLVDKNSPLLPDLRRSLLSIGSYQLKKVYREHTRGVVPAYQRLDYLQLLAWEKGLSELEYLTLVCGRKYFKEGIYIPPVLNVQLPTTRSILSFKGVGSSFNDFSHYDLENDPARGFTHAGIEQDIEALLANAREVFPGLDGECRERAIPLNRYTLATIKLKSIATSSLQYFIDKLNPNVYKAIADRENPLVEIIQMNLLDITIHDIVAHLQGTLSNGNREFPYSADTLIHFLGDNSQATLEYYLAYLYTNLLFHPYYQHIYEKMSGKDVTRDALVNTFFPSLMASFAEFLFDISYIVSRQKYKNQHFCLSDNDGRADNMTFAGPLDLGDVTFEQLISSELFTEETVFDRMIEQSANAMMRIITVMSKLITEQEGMRLKEHFERLWLRPVEKEGCFMEEKVVEARKTLKAVLLKIN